MLLHQAPAKYLPFDNSENLMLPTSLLHNSHHMHYDAARHVTVNRMHCIYKPERWHVMRVCLCVCVVQVIATWRFDWRYMVRGLTIDKQRGNILKIDRHKYVKVAYHGFRELSRAERRAIYSDSNVSQCTLMLP